MRSGRVQSTYQYKVNSGANEIVKRVDAGREPDGTKVLATNIAVPASNPGGKRLHFLPDRLLIRDGKRFSDVDYGTLASRCSPQRFIESKRKPRRQSAGRHDVADTSMSKAVRTGATRTIASCR